jgi:hypothetical protein
MGPAMSAPGRMILVRSIDARLNNEYTTFYESMERANALWRLFTYEPRQAFASVTYHQLEYRVIIMPS